MPTPDLPAELSCSAGVGPRLDGVALVSDRLRLEPLTLSAARAILDDRMPGAPGFPTEGDLVVAGLVEASGLEPTPPWCPYLLVRRVDGAVLGGAGFLAPPRDGVVEVGYGLAESARGQGFATEAVEALCWLAEGHGMSVLAATAPGNVASQRVLGRAGFGERGEREGELLFGREAASAAGRRQGEAASAAGRHEEEAASAAGRRQGEAASAAGRHEGEAAS